MAWCEAQTEIYYCLGLGKNSVLIENLQPALVDARLPHCLCGTASVREFAEIEYRMQKTWSRARREIGKAEATSARDNPRFFVTNLPAEGFAQSLDFRDIGPRIRWVRLCGSSSSGQRFALGFLLTTTSRSRSCPSARPSLCRAVNRLTWIVLMFTVRQVRPAGRTKKSQSLGLAFFVALIGAG